MILDIVIEPTQGEFDLAEIESALLAMPNVARVPKRALKFMLAPDAETLEHSLENLNREHPDRDFTVALVTLGTRRILVNFRSTRVHAPRAFVAWLRRHQPVKILDEEFNDLTAELDSNLDLIFGPEP